ncbi:MAG TPA: YidC/Oxa1 family membrane protein insertase [Rubrobacteraceae bacterium]|nr:YidC/Oxa1 family membrane protein insertase [Rubrobacteraceae bacterium]
MINAIADFFQNIFSPIVQVLGAVLLYFHQQLSLPWWLAIVLLTVVVRTLLFPLTVRQVRSMRAMQELRPELDKIRNKYKDNRQKQQEEQMKLFQERKVNPLGGCLPILLQMPIIIGIFYAVREFGGDPLRNIPPEYPSFRTGGLFWFQDLSVYDPYLILPILSAVTMLASMEITNKSMEPQQRWLMRLMPIGITVFLWRFPAGLFVYWITSNIVTLVQNYAIYNFGPGKKKPRDPTSSSAQKGQSKDEPAQTPNGGDPAAQAAKSVKRKRRKKKKK